jgi:hypothetical protein
MVVTGAGGVVPPEGELPVFPPLPPPAFPPPPQPANATKKRSKPKEMILKRSFRRRFPAIKANVPSGITTTANGRSCCGTNSDEAAGVVTDTVTFTGEPLTFTLVEPDVHALPLGAPVQLSATVPLKPEIGVTATL